MSGRLFVSMPPAIYDKQPKEGAEAFAAFVVFRDMGIARTVDGAYNEQRKRSGKPAAKKASGIWWEWCAENEWKRRASAYDADEDRRRREEAAETRRQEVEAFRQGVRTRARALGAASAKALMATTRAMDSLSDGDITPGQIPNYLRAVTEAMGKSMHWESLSIGINPENGDEMEAA